MRYRFGWRTYAEGGPVKFSLGHLGDEGVDAVLPAADTQVPLALGLGERELELLDLVEVRERHRGDVLVQARDLDAASRGDVLRLGDVVLEGLPDGALGVRGREEHLHARTHVEHGGLQRLELDDLAVLLLAVAQAGAGAHAALLVEHLLRVPWVRGG
jgi:hypothetical protein